MSLLKNALLSVFVGKSGREALKAYEESRKLDDKAPLDGRSKQPVPQSEAEVLPPRPSAHTQGNGRSDLDQAVYNAKLKMARNAAKSTKAAQQTDRQSLIAGALQAHRSKQQMLNELDDETRVKLTMMALSAFMGGDKK